MQRRFQRQSRVDRPWDLPRQAGNPTVGSGGDGGPPRGRRGQCGARDGVSSWVPNDPFALLGPGSGAIVELKHARSGHGPRPGFGILVALACSLVGIAGLAVPNAAVAGAATAGSWSITSTPSDVRAVHVTLLRT